MAFGVDSRTATNDRQAPSLNVSDVTRASAYEALDGAKSIPKSKLPVAQGTGLSGSASFLALLVSMLLNGGYGYENRL
jgi:hypothetical protein